MLDERIIEKLSAYADGELDAQASGELERALAEDAELRGCLEQFRKLDGAGEARLVQLACSTPPEGRSRWSLRLLADQMVALKHVEQCSHMAVKRTLKKTNLSLT